MKPSLWFEASMLALILIASLVYVAAQETERKHLASDNDKTAQLQTDATYGLPDTYS